MQAVGYIRVSSEDQAQSGLSLEHQRAKIEAYALATDLHLVGVIEDAGKSGKSLNREGVQKVLSMVRRGEVQAVVVLRLDRLTRSVRDLGELVELFDKTGAALISVQDSINTKTAAGRLVLNVLGSVAQWEREAIGERTAAALAVKRARGEKTGGTVPYGYDLAPDGKTLTPNALEQEVVGIMLELRRRGYSLRAIAAALSSRGIPSKTGRRWYAQTVKEILAAGAARAAQAMPA